MLPIRKGKFFAEIDTGGLESSERAVWGYPSAIGGLLQRSRDPGMQHGLCEFLYFRRSLKICVTVITAVYSNASALPALFLPIFAAM